MMKQKTKFKQTEIGMIPEDWEVVLFRDILTGNIKHGIYKSKEFIDEKGVKILKMGVQYSSRRIGAQEMERIMVSENELDRFNIKEGDLIFSRTSMMTEGAGNCSIVVRHDEPIIFDGNLLCAELNKKIANPEFYFYFFSSRTAKHEIAKITTGTQSRNIAGSKVMMIPVPKPAIIEQQSIAKILSDLDSKIELNQQMNKTLEATGQAIFRHWFVDFEFPNEKGKQYKSSGGEMVDSELGKIPEGWRVQELGDIVIVKGGTTPSTENPAYWEQGTISWCTPKDLSRLNSSVLLQTERQITQLGLERISSGLLPKGTLLLSSRAPIGYIAISEIDTAINQGFIAIISSQGLSNQYLLNWVKSNMEKIKSMASGTTFQEINKANFRKIKIIVPPSELLKRFDALAENLHRRIVENETMILSLSSIRDSLLPKLMSGKIRVPVEVK